MRGVGPSGERATPAGLLARVPSWPLVWYAVLLGVTLAAKVVCLRRFYHRELDSVLSFDGEGPAGLLLRIFGMDVVEVAVGVTVLCALGHGLLRIPPSILCTLGTAAAATYGGLQVIASQQLGSYLGGESFEIFLSWTSQHPDVLASWITPAVLGVIGVGILITGLPGGWIALELRGLVGGPAWRVPSAVALAAVVAIAAFAGAQPRSREIAGAGFWSASLVQLLTTEHAPLPPVPDSDRLRAEIGGLCYPGERGEAKPWLTLAPGARRPRHVLFVSLETAPRRYYPLLEDPELETFQAMSRHALVSERHYATTPFTTWSVFSMLSGTYPPPGESMSDYGDFRSDALASVLVEHGYESVFVDSFRIDWRGADDNRSTWSNLGFQRLVEGAELGAPAGAERERAALRSAAQSLIDAHARGRRAVVFLATIRGHSPWHEKGGDAAPAKVVRRIVREFDAAFAELLATLEAAGLRDEVIVVVTGDHGLRYGDEYEALGEQPGDLEIAFNVPLLIYAPGLFPAQVRLPHLSSHVDLVPTLFDLLGIESRGMIHHGQSLLASGLEARATFFVNRRLVPVDAYHWSGRFVTWNRLTGHTETASRADRRDARPFDSHAADVQELPAALRDPPAFLGRLGPLLRLTAAYQVARRAGTAPAPGEIAAAR
jgi:hypothetical protein